MKQYNWNLTDMIDQNYTGTRNREGVPQSYRRIHWRNSTLYIGEVKNGIIEGKGTCHFDEESQYEEKWQIKIEYLENILNHSFYDM